MELEHDEIIEISPARQRYFGTTGKMLLPCPATVAALILKIPAGRVATSEQLRSRLARDFNVQVTCPVTTQKALKVIAKDSSQVVPYWRVIKKNGELLRHLAGDIDRQVASLASEGIAIDSTGKTPRVVNFKQCLAEL
jgi:alkylated DNA nucleotide flippase Atl1